jgi:putative ABC transport system permease protein
VLRHTLRSLLAYKGRLLLTAVAIVVGVGAVAGTFVLGDSAKAAADAAFAEATPRVDVVVRSAPQGEGEVFSDITGELFAQPMPASAVDQAARVDGVAAAAGVVVGDAHLVGRDGHVVGVRAPLGRSVDQSFAGALRAGRVPAGPGEIVIDRITAAKERFGVGDQARVIASGAEPRTVTVVGIVDSPEIPDAVVLVGFDPVTARRLLAPTGQVSYLELRAVPGLGQQALRDRVAAALGPGYQAFTETTLAAERARNATPQEGGLSQVLFVAAVVALFAGTFIIRNTFSIVLAAQTRELALLRCIGASRGQLRRSILLQALVVGALAAVVGLALGIGLAWGLGAVLRAADEAVADVGGGNLRVLPRTVAVALAVGIVTALVSAWGPARRATRVAPVAALRGDVFALDRRTSRARTVVGTLAALAGVGAVLAGALDDPVRSSYLWAGAVAAVAGVLVLGPVLARALSSLLGLPVARARGVAGQLARGNAVRSPRRTSATVLPLVIGLALISFVTTLAAGTKASTAGSLERAFSFDFRLRAAGTGMHQPSMSEQVAQRLGGLPELAALVPFQSTGVMVAGAPAVDAGVAAADPVQLGRVLSLPVRAGALADLGPGAVAVDAPAADAGHLALGAPVRLQAPGGAVATFTVRAIYDTASLDDFVRQELPVADFLVTPADFRRLAGDATGLTVAYARARDGLAPAAARAAIERAVGDYPNVEIASRDELIRQTTAQIDPTLRLFYSLLGLAVVVALAGIVNTLVLSILERVRELGLLRAIGMDRRQLGSMVRWEAVIIAAIGVTIGLGLGTFLGWATTVALELSTPAIPVVQLAGFAAAAVLASVLAAAVPARRAARIDLLRAIATE